jgi:hypothetical protein
VDPRRDANGAAIGTSSPTAWGVDHQLDLAVFESLTDISGPFPNLVNRIGVDGMVT